MGRALATTLLVLLLAASGAVTTARAGGDLEPASPGATAARPSRQAATPVVPPAGGCLDRTIDALQARYETVSDLRAHFTQSTRPAHLGTIVPDPVTSHGHMVVAKPAKMRWVYEKPEASVVVSDGESLWIYDPAFGEAQRLPVSEGFLSGAAVQFLLGEGDLRRDFEITLVGCDDDRAELELVPREPATYEKLRIVADPRTGALSRTQINDLLGNITVLELSQLEINQNPDPEVFRFVPPEGVSVIELDPSGSLRP